MGYTIVNHLDNGWFKLLKSTKSNLSINYYLDKHNIDLNDYWVLKYTNNFRLIDINDVGKYAGIICFRKDKFNKKDIDRWLLLTDMFWIGFLDKPFPPIEILNKINIIEWDIQ